MKLTPEEQQTIDAYDQNATAWAQSRNKKGDWLEEKMKFREHLSSGKVLEIGSGAGRDAKDLVAAGYDYIGTDISLGLLKEAKKNNPDLTFLHQSVYELDFPENSFDGFWANAILLHMPKARIDEALKSIHNVLKKDAVGFISLKKGDQEKFVVGDHHGIDYKRFFAFYYLDEFARILKRNNFGILESYELFHSGKTWLIFFVKTI